MYTAALYHDTVPENIMFSTEKYFNFQSDKTPV